MTDIREQCHYAAAPAEDVHVFEAPFVELLFVSQRSLINNIGEPYATF